MARTTDAKVGNILDTSVTSFTSFITPANLLVTNVLFTPSIIVDTDLLTEIETWVAAHLFAVSLERQAKEEKTGEAGVKYMGEDGKGLESTTYGQTAITLDHTGTLADLGKRKARIDTILAIAHAEKP
jgi:hypothetical protein